jgi:hypothetical protein
MGVGSEEHSGSSRLHCQQKKLNALFAHGELQAARHAVADQAQLRLELVHVGALGVALALPGEPGRLLVDMLPHLPLEVLPGYL